MKELLLAVVILIANSLSFALASNSDYKNVFEKYYIITSVSDNAVSINRRIEHDEIKIKIGEEFNSPTDRHSKVIYRIKKINNSEVGIVYRSEFNASSFIGGIKNESGEFTVNVNVNVNK